jgi:hypothetical protein
MIMLVQTAHITSSVFTLRGSSPTRYFACYRMRSFLSAIWLELFWYLFYFADMI